MSESLRTIQQVLPLLQGGAHTVFLFFAYSILGWMVEVAYAGLTERRLINRGFLCGPLCPIYGFGMLALVGTMQLLPPAGAGKESWLEVFLVGMFVTTLIELVGGWALYKIFHTRWWDYSHFPFNLGGYICPQFSVLWGLGSLIMVKVVHPLVDGIGLHIPLVPLLVIDAFLLLDFGVDLGVSAASAVGLNEKLRELDELREALSSSSNKLTDAIGGRAITLDTMLEEPKLQLTLAAMEGRENAAEYKAELTRNAAALRNKLDAISRDKIGSARLLRAFPDMRSDKHRESVSTLRSYAHSLYHRTGTKVAQTMKKDS